MNKVIIIIFMVLALSCCGEKTPDESKKVLTQNQRDSVLAESKIPGAGKVGKAIEVADSASARKEKLDELEE